MIEIILANVAAQATGIPEGVWIALIAAISGGLIKPAFDMFAQVISSRKEASEAEQKRAIAKERGYKEQIAKLQQDIIDIKAEQSRTIGRLQSELSDSLKEQTVLREKYWEAMERFNTAHATPIPQGDKLDLTDPSVLRQFVRQITEA